MFNFMKFSPVDTSYSLRTDGRPDMSKLIVIFHNFGKVPKNYMRVCERVTRVIRQCFPKSEHVVKQHVRNKTPVSFHMVLTCNSS